MRYAAPLSLLSLLSLLPFFLAGCSAIAPFGDFMTGATPDADAPVDAGPATADAEWSPPGMCDGGAYVFDAGAPVDPAGMEICNRRDDDGDVRVDENLMVASPPQLSAGVAGLGDTLRATVGLRPDTIFAAFVSSASDSRGRLRAVELRTDGEANEQLVSPGTVTTFDVATSAAGYVIAWVEGGQVRFTVADPCSDAWGAAPLMLAPVDATHVSVETSRDGLEAYVVWSGPTLGGVRIDLRSRPVIGPVGTLDQAGVEVLESAVSVTAGTAWVSSIQREATRDVVVVRRLGADGTFGAGTEASGAGLTGTGPFQNVATTLDPEDFLILAFDVGNATGTVGQAFAREIRLPELSLQAARAYGGDALIGDLANDGSASSGVLLRIGGRFVVERVGANPDGNLSTDATMNVPALDRVGWLALVGFREGAYRYAAVGRDESGALRVQPITCN